MSIVVLILLVLAIVLLFVAAFGGAVPKVNLGWLGLAVWALSQLLTRFPPA